MRNQINRNNNPTTPTKNTIPIKPNKPQHNNIRRVILVVLGTLLVFFLMSTTHKSATNHLSSQPETHIDYSDSFLIHVQYPQTSSSKLNKHLLTSIQTAITNFKQLAHTKTSTEPAELNIDYEIQGFANRFLSIRFLHYTFIDNASTTTSFLNYDLKTNSFFSLGTILDLTKLKQALQHNNKPTTFPLDTTDFAINQETFFLDNEQFPIAFIKPFLKIDLSFEATAIPFFCPPLLPNPISNKPMIALTFDDGPSFRFTTRIINTLKQYESHATFFVVGRKIKDYASLLNEVIANGNELGNHTFHHKRLTSLTSEEAKQQIQMAQDEALTYLNYDMKIIRPPYGTFSPATKLFTNHPQIMWTLDTRDWESRNTKKIIDKVLTNVKENDIILFHDIYKSTADAIDELVPLLIAQGFQLVTVSELMANSGYVPK